MTTTAMIAFDRMKYERHLLVDAADVSRLPGFITHPVPHRLQFFELALCRSGAGVLELDDEAVPVEPGAVLLTRPGQTRRWKLCAPLRADVVFFDDAVFERSHGIAAAAQDLPLFHPAHREQPVRGTPAAFRRLTGLAREMKREFRQLRADSPALLHARLCCLMLEVQRVSGSRRATPSPRLDLCERFKELVDQRIVEWRNPRAYANAMGTSPAYLSQCMRRETGRTAGQIIQRRLFALACSKLAGTPCSVARVSADLGFSEPAYFHRFFRRHAGMTPRAYRQQQKVQELPRFVP